MASESIPPPPGGGGLKYGIIGLLLLAAAVGIWFATRDADEPPPEEPEPPVAEGPKRSSSLSRSDLDIPEEEPDAGVAAEEEPEPEPTRPRRRARARCDGEIDQAKIQAFIQKQRPQVRNCYERRLKVNNVLQGRVEVEVRVKANGAVETVRVGGSLGDAEVYGCVRQLAQDWQLPPLSEGSCAVMKIPFNLTPSR
ncbi:MAG: AgmX/PglI C-terminal domain-containing protein [Myxococcota bacterium]